MLFCVSQCCQTDTAIYLLYKSLLLMHTMQSNAPVVSRLLLPFCSSVVQNFTPFQYQDPSGKLMMLPSDIVLIEDKSFKK